MKAQSLLRKSCIGSLCSVEVKLKTELDIQSISIVSEFPDVFPDEQPGIPP